MKPKHYIPVITAIFALFVSFLLTGCSGYRSISGIEMKNKETINIVSGDFVYDDIKVIVFYADGDTREVTLTKDMIPDTDKLNFFKLGEHEIRVIYNDSYFTTMKINVVNDEFDDIYKLEDLTCDYDGKPHKIEINYEVPEGATVEYPYGNTFTNAGEYEIVAVISKQGYISKRLSANLVINKAQYDLSNVVFEDQTFTYDGTAKNEEVTVKNVPKGVVVDYDIYNADKSVKLKSATDAGTYVMVAKFTSSDENYDQMSTKEATITINKATYDMSTVRLDDATKEYDGKPFQPKLAAQSNLPQGVTTKFTYYNQAGEEVESCVNAGEYKVVASFSGDAKNYEEIKPLEAKLTITKKPIMLNGVVSFNSSTVNFDRTVHTLKVEGKIPESVNITYENNDQIAAGEYKIIAHFTNDNPNEELDITQLEEYLIINRINESIQVLDADSGEPRPLEDKDLELTVEQLTGKKDISIKGFMEDKYYLSSITFTTQPDNQNPEGKEITDISDFSNGEKYNYRIVATFKDEVENGSVSLAPATGTVSYEIKFDDDYKLDDLEVVYDGKAHGLKINKELPYGTTVTYPNGEEFTNYNKDPYTVVWELSKDTYAPKRIEGKLTITKATYDMSKVVLENVTRVYDGNNYSPADKNSPTYNSVFDNLPEGVTVKSVEIHYWNNGAFETDSTQFSSDVGKYRVDIKYTSNDSDLETGNYIPVEDASYELEITPAPFDPNKFGVGMSDLEVPSTGYPGYLSLWNTPTVAATGAGYNIDLPNFNYIPADDQGLNSYPLPIESSKLPNGIFVIYTYYKDGNVINIFDTTKKYKFVSFNEIYLVEGGTQTLLTLPLDLAEYTVKATFISNNPNYTIPNDLALTAKLTIKPL